MQPMEPTAEPIEPVSADDVTGLVLAGGRGSRMGGADKGLQLYRGVPLALHALRRLAPQVRAARINANRNLAAYARFGVPVWPDGAGPASDAVADDFAGPLAGFIAGLERCETPWLVTVPCDTPEFPLDLVARLAAGLAGDVAGRPRVAIARTPSADGSWTPQPVFCLLHVSTLAGLRRFVADGGRRVERWASQQGCALVDFSDAAGAADNADAGAFANVNTLAELDRLETRGA